MEKFSKYNTSPNHALFHLIRLVNRQYRFLLRAVIVLACLLTTVAHLLQAQDLDVPYVPTPEEVVEGMLDAVDVGPGDYVIDLGSGDGRIVIAAARRGAVGHGVELNPERVEESRVNARNAGVSGRVMFLEENIFETDFNQASVITMYLLSSVNRELRPVLLDKLRPGTRVVSHSFGMGDWEADEELRINNRTVYVWMIPADVEGQWQWQVDGSHFSMRTQQEYQHIDVSVNAGNRTLTTEEAILNGGRISLIVHDTNGDKHYLFNGLVNGDSITGTVQIHDDNPDRIEEWSATRN